MKTNDQNKFPRRLNNHGFSLVELIISIAILAIIMIPLMNNFFRSMQMNKKAEELQVKSNVASNIMEGLKILPIQMIQEQFSSVGSFNIINNSVDEVKRLYYNEATTQYQDNPPISQAPYYFTIHGIKEGSTAYDALITMDPTPYNDIDPVDDIMNDYLMPDVINLDEKANGLLLSMGKTTTDTMDSDVLNIFTKQGEDYARSLYEQSPEYLDYLVDLDVWKEQIELEKIQGVTPLTPMPIQPSTNPGGIYDPYLINIINKISKKMQITVSTTTEINDTVKYQIKYYCDWSEGTLEKEIIYPVSTKQYKNTISNIYLFYAPSNFQNDHSADKIVVDNLGNDPINFHIAKQGAGNSIPNNIEIQRSSAVDKVSVFTNIDVARVTSIIGGLPGGSINENIVKTNKKNRIYKITVNLYEYVNSVNPADKYKKLLYTLESTNEE